MFSGPENTMQKVKHCLVKDDNSVDKADKVEEDRKVGTSGSSQKDVALPSSMHTATNIDAGLKKAR